MTGRGNQVDLARSRGYLRIVRAEGWLPAEGLVGRYFCRTSTTARMSARTAVHSWQTFLAERAKPSREYQLDDVVYSGRMSFLAAAQGNSTLLSHHANIQPSSATRYCEDLRLPAPSAREVLDRLQRSIGKR